MDLKQHLETLKYDYIRIQGDLEKIESTGQAPDKMLKQLESLEREIKETKDKIKKGS
ncbi:MULTISPECIES: SE1832 family protein [Nosocomiicoccus]|uniref:SE1832 family protein n=1 Tax=Nosocomiicoccus TaxID=489909 RepID=UPI0003FAF57E|nr:MULTISPECIES: SE1832 family protein [Nosocomiicoccus]